MMTILHLDSGICRENSRLGAAIVSRLKREHPDAEIIHRDIDGIRPLNAGSADFADRVLVEEFLNASVIVIGAPPKGLTVPPPLKAWLDRISIAGKTLRYGPRRVEGIADSRRIIVASTGTTPVSTRGPVDHHAVCLKTVFGILGIDDIDFVHA